MKSSQSDSTRFFSLYFCSLPSQFVNVFTLFFCCFFSLLASISCIELVHVVKNPDRFPVGTVEESCSKMSPACIFISSQCDVFCRRPPCPLSFHLCHSSFPRGNQVACYPSFPPSFFLSCSWCHPNLSEWSCPLPPAAVVPGIGLLQRCFAAATRSTRRFNAVGF